jgi:pimeloyl-ACP methyl ester carboxylesterase
MADAIAVLDRVAQGPQVLVGSSMGGWIMLLTALARPRRVAGLVGVAAAPDFTEDLMWARLSEEARGRLMAEGVYHHHAEYGEDPYPITRTLIEEGREHLLLRGAIGIDCPVRLIHGMADGDVHWEVSLRLCEALRSEDVTLALVKGGDHRLSGPGDIDRLTATIEALCRKLEG